MITEHGRYKYLYDGCHCTVCRAGNAAYARQRRAERKAWLAAGNPLPANVKHGDSAYTNWGCRCDLCSAAHAAKQFRGLHPFPKV